MVNEILDKVEAELVIIFMGILSQKSRRAFFCIHIKDRLLTIILSRISGIETKDRLLEVRI